MARIAPTSCPRCEAREKFAPRERPSSVEGVIEEYIVCKRCRYTMILGYTTQMLKQALKREHEWARRVSAEQNRHGHPTSTTTKRYQAAIHHRTGLQAEVDRRMRDVAA